MYNSSIFIPFNLYFLILFLLFFIKSSDLTALEKSTVGNNNRDKRIRFYLDEPNSLLQVFADSKYLGNIIFK